VKRRIKTFVLLTVCFVAVAVVAIASQGRVISGTVTDENGEPVEGAVVKLSSPSVVAVRSAITRDDGTYHFSGLNGRIDYYLRARHEDRQSRRHKVSRFSGGDEHTVDLRLTRTRSESE
jgi:hypothetical protein